WLSESVSCRVVFSWLCFGPGGEGYELDNVVASIENQHERSRDARQCARARRRESDRPCAAADRHEYLSASGAARAGGAGRPFTGSERAEHGVGAAGRVPGVL